MTRRLLFVLGLATLASNSNAFATPPTPGLTKFVDPLPLLPRIVVPNTPGPYDLTLTMSQITTKIHRDLPDVPVFGYGGSSPGPLIEVEKGQDLRVHWQDSLPEKHLFALPKYGDQTLPDVRAVTHLHGAAVVQPGIEDKANDNDGWPDAWIQAGATQTADYPNDQSARFLWYHDHAMGSTGRNVAAGLYGAYVIRDADERALNLPQGAYEIPLLLHAMAVDATGQLSYTDDLTAEFWGNTVAVNGKLWPYLEVEPRRYRFRVVNASNARSYALKLIDQSNKKPGPAFYQIGSDSGFLPAPALLNDPAKFNAPRLILAPGERADVVIDFTGLAGKTFTLDNNNHDPADDEVALTDLMQIRVGTSVSSPDTSTPPANLALQPVPRLAETEAATTRRMVLDQMTMDGVPNMLAINGKMWMDPIEEKPKLGATEIWEIVNTLIMTHPFHIHLVQFQVLDRRLFDVDAYRKTGQINYLADAVKPAPAEMGWKDTVRALPQMVTRIIMRFTPFPGFYVYHCHILEHEDMDMMRPFEVVQPGPTSVK